MWWSNECCKNEFLSRKSFKTKVRGSILSDLELKLPAEISVLEWQNQL